MDFSKQLSQGDFEILACSEPTVARLAAVLLEHPKATVRIGGHTNGGGPKDENRHWFLQLSIGRAEAVKQRLVSLGVGSGRMACKGFAGDVPVVTLTPAKLLGGPLAGIVAGVGCSMTWGPAGAFAGPAGVLAAGFVGMVAGISPAYTVLSRNMRCEFTVL